MHIRDSFMNTLYDFMNTRYWPQYKQIFQVCQAHLYEYWFTITLWLSGDLKHSENGQFGVITSDD